MKLKDGIFAYFMLIVYGIIGVLIRYLMIPTCNSELKFLNTIGGLYALPLILICGVGVGLFSFIWQKKIPRTGQGIVTGFGVGFGIMTVIAILINNCV